MTTEADRLNVLETKLDSFIEETRTRLASLEARLNVQIQVTVAMWVTTMFAVLATLVAVLMA